MILVLDIDFTFFHLSDIFTSLTKGRCGVAMFRLPSVPECAGSGKLSTNLTPAPATSAQ